MYFLRITRLRRWGFTLVELSVTIFIASIISAAIISVFVVGKRTWYVGSTQVIVQEEARRAVDKMSQALTFSSPAQVNIGASQDTVTFSQPDNVDGAGQISWSAPIQYSLNNSQILETIGAENKVVANDIQTLQFTALGANGIRIVVGAQKNTLDGRSIEYALTSQVYFRNP